MRPLASLSSKVIIVCSVLLFASCSKIDWKDLFHPPKHSDNKPNLIFYALAAGNTLDKISTYLPEMPVSSVSISGLPAGETILSIDFRPATGQLYGLSSASKLYIIQPESGKAMPVGTGSFSPALNGTLTGFDFNPTVDRIRVVTNAGQNLRLNPETGAVAATDGNINGQPGAAIAAVAYTNNKAGASSTTLYDIDITASKLFRQDPPNNGTLVEVGSLSVKVSGEGGFDIAPDGTALALFKVNNKSTLFTLDLNTGNTVILARYAKDYSGIAIPTDPVAYAVSETNQLLIFNPMKTAEIIMRPITGLMTGENILGIDFRPLNGQLYALGSTSRLYTVNASNGAATAVGTMFSTVLSGTYFGFDFNPMADRIRVISDTRQNLRLHPDLGTVAAVDGMLDPVGATGAAYTNNFAGTTTTTLYDINAVTDKLYIQNPPNNGNLTEVGNLGVNVESVNGFDISSTNGIAYAILTSGGVTKIYTVNLTTGATIPFAEFPVMVRGFTVGLGL